MITEKAKIMEGFITVKDLYTEEVLLKKSNNIVSNGLAIAIRCLSGVSFHIDRITVIDSNTVLISNKLTAINYPQNNIVEFVSVFDPVDFSGTFDELNLESSTGGKFSEATGLSLSKSSSQRISISWQIKIT